MVSYFRYRRILANSTHMSEKYVPRSAAPNVLLTEKLSIAAGGTAEEMLACGGSMVRGTDMAPMLGLADINTQLVPPKIVRNVGARYDRTAVVQKVRLPRLLRVRSASLVTGKHMELTVTRMFSAVLRELRERGVDAWEYGVLRRPGLSRIEDQIGYLVISRSRSSHSSLRTSRTFLNSILDLAARCEVGRHPIVLWRKLIVRLTSEALHETT